MSFGEKAKSRRIFLKKKQEDIGLELGYTKGAISKIENDNNSIPINKLLDYAKALKTSPAYLMGWVDDPELSHEQTLGIERDGELNYQILAADTGSVDDVLVLSGDTVDEVQKHRNALANKIRNSDYTEEQLEKIEDMIKVITR